jgi:hypothetical protein
MSSFSQHPESRTCFKLTAFLAMISQMLIAENKPNFNPPESSYRVVCQHHANAEKQEVSAIAASRRTSTITDT